MKPKPCKHLKSDRYVRWQDREWRWRVGDNPGHLAPEKLHVYCTKCGKKLREVVVHD